ncbi:GNAT family N-acetyltransferase [Alicyclobacillus sp. ALC3]|uniref:GNAT family N-acetyltransferase n=1 Tax=Alicyclobacillus sp. ALC3 TaxID=2796143 RepID=UPI00237803FA|nr:GNAT family N-acetyltransferase [Alicyclobacillus sp. ALC3]
MSLNTELARKLEGDLLEGNKELMQVWNEVDQKSELKVLELENIVAVYGGPDCPINEAVGLGMYGPVQEEFIEAIEEFYGSNNDDTEIRVCPLAHKSLVEFTQKRGYVLSGFSYRWVLNLESWTSPVMVPDSRVRPAMPQDEDHWSKAVASGFADQDNISQTADLTLEHAFFRMKSSIPFIAEEKGKVVAGGVLALSDDVASLFATSTLPSYRGRGIQTGLLDSRLQYAKDHGARIATIETDPGSASQRNVERVGFRLAYVTAELVKHRR